jgi:hypothetical protein
MLRKIEESEYSLPNGCKGSYPCIHPSDFLMKFSLLDLCLEEVGFGSNDRHNVGPIVNGSMSQYIYRSVHELVLGENKVIEHE